MNHKFSSFLFVFLLSVLGISLTTPALAVPNAPLRIADSFSYAASSLNSPVNAATTFNAIQFYGTEPGEPQHLCRSGGASVGTSSGWTVVTIPAGSLTVDTLGSNYDTLVSVYSGGPNFSQLVSIGCNDDRLPAGNGTSSLLTVPIATGGRYYIQTSRFATETTTAAQTLVLSVMFTGAKPAPANDNFASAQLLPPAQYTKVTVKGTEYATIEGSEPKSSCLGTNELSHSVWFQYVSPSRSVLAFSVRGAGQNDVDGFNNYTMIAVYKGASLTALTEYGCDTTGLGYHMVPIVESVNANANDVFYIQVARRRQGLSPVGASSYTLVIQHLLASDNIKNESFTTGLAPWKLSHGSNDAVDCTGTCRFVFNSSAKEKSVLKQKYKLPAGFKKAVGDTARVDISLATPGTEIPSLTFKLKILYSDGTPTTTTTLKPKYFSPATNYSYFTLIARTTSKNVSGFQVEIANKSKSGVVHIYNVSDDYESVRVAGRGAKAAQGALPLPPAPAQ